MTRAQGNSVPIIREQEGGFHSSYIKCMLSGNERVNVCIDGTKMDEDKLDLMTHTSKRKKIDLCVCVCSYVLQCACA